MRSRMELIQSMLETDPNCALCGNNIELRYTANHPLQATLDHIRPKKCGGKTTPDNLQLAHLFCNNKKGSKFVYRVPMGQGVLYQVVANDFVAGFVSFEGKIKQTAPVLRWAKKNRTIGTIEYMSRHGWQVNSVEQ